VLFLERLLYHFSPALALAYAAMAVGFSVGVARADDDLTEREQEQAKLVEVLYIDTV
jgi:hypothetical protein